jgi:hypothetical protein
VREYTLRMIKSRTMAKLMGVASDNAAALARINTKRISSVAYATEDNASEEKTARATSLDRRW